MIVQTTLDGETTDISKMEISDVKFMLKKATILAGSGDADKEEMAEKAIKAITETYPEMMI